LSAEALATCAVTALLAYSRDCVALPAAPSAVSPFAC